MLHAYHARQLNENSWRSLMLLLRHARFQAFRFLAVAFMLRDILGFISADLGERDFYIALLAIYPQFRGRGHSKPLLSQAEALAIAQDCDRLVLDVDESNTVARAAYQSAGFKQIAASKTLRIGEDSFRVLRLAKPLTNSG